jgi:hypothetical protein
MELQGNALTIEFLLQSRYRHLHGGRSIVVNAADTVGCTINLPKAGTSQQSSQFDSLVQIPATVIETGKYVAMVVDHFCLPGRRRHITGALSLIGWGESYQGW